MARLDDTPPCDTCAFFVSEAKLFSQFGLPANESTAITASFARTERCFGAFYASLQSMEQS